MIDQIYTIQAKINLSIAVVSDLHGKPYEKVVKSLRNRHPDIIAIPGDFILGKRPKDNGVSLDISVIKYQDNVLLFLKTCATIAPTYISLGNHEAFLDEEDIELIKSTEVVLLDNEFYCVHVRDNQVVIGGLSAGHVINYRKFKKKYLKDNGRTERYPTRVTRDMPKWFDVDDGWLDEFEKQDGYKILLSHHPEYWSIRKPKLCNRTIDLVLSGHAHGGQIRLFGKGIYAPGQRWFPKYTKGVYEGIYGSMVVSTGLSNTGEPIPRLFNPTEIVYVNLK